MLSIRRSPSKYSERLILIPKKGKIDEYPSRACAWSSAGRTPVNQSYSRYLALVVIILFLLIEIFPFGYSQGISSSSQNTVQPNASYANQAPVILTYLPVAIPSGSINTNATVPYNQVINVLVSFSLSNQTRLNSYISNLSNPDSNNYHHYLTRNEFAQNYSISANLYMKAVSYFLSYPGLSVRTYQDRISLEVTGHASALGKPFRTAFASVPGKNGTYFAIAEPILPSWLAGSVNIVLGLSNIKINFNLNMNSALLANGNTSKSQFQGYPSPICSGTSQYIYGSDLQVAYHERSLLNITYPVNEVVATILWGGCTSTHQYVSDLYAPAIYRYYNSTLPTYEPHSKVYGVPVCGAVPPGSSANSDVTGVTDETTLDLEMIGSTAPGSSIYNVYSKCATIQQITQALAFILNPNSTYSALNNVSVISNSWGGCDSNNSAWYTYLQEAQARGITVLASSGDSCDNPNSSKYFANTNPGDYTEFPSAMSFNAFGVTGVGGTTIKLNTALAVSCQTAWQISASDTADGGPAGSTGGISSIFPEPSWQLNSSANNIIKGAGRGVPDIAAIANNTIVCITTSGGSSSPVVFWGTSIASPVEAGIIAEINAVLSKKGQSSLGFLNPMLYNIANRQFSEPACTSTTGFIPTGTYNSSLPTQPFMNIQTGQNAVYKAGFGYSLVTGWGSLDAYNLTIFLLSTNFSNSYIALQGVGNTLNLTGLNVTSYFFNATTLSYSTVNSCYNASIQQNFFIADELGAPIYWIQNVIYINGSESTGWRMNYTGWVVYPFYGLYPSSTLYEYNFPLTGKDIVLPHTFEIRSWISGTGSNLGRTLNFEVNTHLIQLPVPGAAYIIGGLNYTYCWQGVKYLNGPFPNNNVGGGLDPQLGIVGGPSGGLGKFMTPSGGTLSSCVEPYGSTSFEPANTKAFSTNIDQTGEAACNLIFNKTSQNTWNVELQNGSTEQGILSYAIQAYNITFVETGLPGGTSWGVNLSNGYSVSGSGNNLSAFLANGTYSYIVNSGNRNYTAKAGSFSVTGSSFSLDIQFYRTSTNLSVRETGLPAGTEWFFNITNVTGVTSLYNGTGTLIQATLQNGNYTFTVTSSDPAYTANLSSGSVTLCGVNYTIFAGFSGQRYTVTFVETGLPTNLSWYVNITSARSGPITSNSYSTGLQNGVYLYTVASSSRHFVANYTGKLTVSFSGVNVSIHFSEAFTVKFNETGLPNGSSWTVELRSGSGKTSNTTSQNSTISFCLENGTYSYRNISVNKSYEPLSTGGSLVVSGNPVTLNTVVFQLITFALSFSEAGLPAGLSWSVSLAGGGISPATNNSTTGIISFNVPNGSYSYRIISADKDYSPNSTGGFVAVNGSNVSVPVIKFNPFLSAVTFSETGLPSGTKFSIDINATTPSSINGSIRMSLLNGTYAYSVVKVPGYTSSVNASNITVQGSALSIQVKFTPTSQASGNSLLQDIYSHIYYVIFLMIIIGAIIGLSIAARRTGK